MSWQRGQGLNGGNSPLLQMQGMAAVGHMKPFVEAALAAMPDGVDWGVFQAGVQKFLGQRSEVKGQTQYCEVGRVGRVALLDAGGNGPVVVVVPSMVNRGYVLDLCEGYSLVAALRERGFRMMVVDWGVPEVGKVLGVEEVVAGHLLPLLQNAVELNEGPVNVFGYCMGGVLSVAAASMVGAGVVGKLALGAVPWDFSVTASAGHMGAARAALEQMAVEGQVIPPEVLNTYFWALDPWSGVQRLMAYGRETDPARLVHMTALETWLHDGLPLDGPVAKEMLVAWYADNKPLRGEWAVQGHRVNPRTLAMPVWVAVTQHDKLVPAASSMPLVAQLPNPTVVQVNTGHVGLVCGRKAPTLVYGPLAAWLHQG